MSFELILKFLRGFSGLIGGSLIQLFLCLFTRPIASNQMLGNMVWAFDCIFYGAVSVPLNYIFNSVTRADLFCDFLYRILVCVFVGRDPHSALSGSRSPRVFFGMCLPASGT